MWSNVDAEELAALSRLAMKWGQKNRAVASTVKGLVEVHDYAQVAVIFVPRIQTTVDIIRKTKQPRKPRVKKEKDTHADYPGM